MCMEMSLTRKVILNLEKRIYIDTCWPMTILAQMRGEELVIHEECSGLLLDHTAKG